MGKWVKERGLLLARRATANHRCPSSAIWQQAGFGSSRSKTGRANSWP